MGPHQSATMLRATCPPGRFFLRPRQAGATGKVKQLKGPGSIVQAGELLARRKAAETLPIRGRNPGGSYGEWWEKGTIV